MIVQVSIVCHIKTTLFKYSSDIELQLFKIPKGSVGTMVMAFTGKIKQLYSKRTMDNKAVLTTWMALLGGQAYPEAVHNQVAIKLLKSGLFTLRYVMNAWLLHTDFVFIYIFHDFGSPLSYCI